MMKEVLKDQERDDVIISTDLRSLYIRRRKNSSITFAMNFAYMNYSV